MLVNIWFPTVEKGDVSVRVLFLNEAPACAKHFIFSGCKDKKIY